MPKICGKCEHYIFVDRQDGKDKLINECAEGIKVVSNKSLKEGCKLFRKCAKCSRCGVLIGSHHLNTNPILLDNKPICGMCYEDQANKDNHKHKLTHAERGSLGGYATFALYKSEGMSEWGKKGGRSRLPTLAVIRQQQLLIAQYKKEGLDTPGKLPNNLKELRKLLRHRSNGHKQIQEGLGVTSSLLAPGSNS